MAMAKEVKVTVQYWGNIARIVPQREESLLLPAETTFRTVLNNLADRYEGVREMLFTIHGSLLLHVRVNFNDQSVKDSVKGLDTPIEEDGLLEIFVVSPMCGG
ncbi:MAG: MoaD/ThiS family protein [Firmicutes bacterium]|nr:MoaD/ThiS family protein [Bacillota bacterium]